MLRTRLLLPRLPLLKKRAVHQVLSIEASLFCQQFLSLMQSGMHSSGSGNSVKLRIIYKYNQNLLRHSFNQFVNIFYGKRISYWGKLFCVDLWIGEVVYGVWIWNVVLWLLDLLTKSLRLSFNLLEKLNAWCGEMLLKCVTCMPRHLSL